MSSKQERRRALIARTRAAYADRNYGRLKAAWQAALKRHVAEIAARARHRADPIIPNGATERWARELAQTQRALIYGMTGHAWQLAAADLGVTGKSAQVFSGKAIGVGDAPENFLTRADFSAIDRWIANTAESASYTTAQRLQKIFRNAADYYDEEKQRGMTPPEIAQEILSLGGEMSETRAAMLAHTGAIWSYNEGAMQRYAAEGVAVMEWLTSDDDLKCPFCAEMNGKRVDVGESFFQGGDALTVKDVGTLKIPASFDIKHPPLHPRCRCTLIPIIDERQI